MLKRLSYARIKENIRKIFLHYIKTRLIDEKLKYSLPLSFYRENDDKKKNFNQGSNDGKKPDQGEGPGSYTPQKQQANKMDKPKMSFEPAKKVPLYFLKW